MVSNVINVSEVVNLQAVVTKYLPFFFLFDILDSNWLGYELVLLSNSSFCYGKVKFKFNFFAQLYDRIVFTGR